MKIIEELLDADMDIEQAEYKWMKHYLQLGYSLLNTHRPAIVDGKEAIVRGRKVSQRYQERHVIQEITPTTPNATK